MFVMRRVAFGGIFLVSLATFAAVQAAEPQQPTQSAQSTGNFAPPHCVTASNISYPINTSVSGLVTFSVSLDEVGHIANVQTLRDVPPLTQAALVALNTWSFAPAMLNGDGVPSTINVDILFNPGNAAFGNPPPLAPDEPGTSQNGPYTPPRISSAAYADYPITTMLEGAVVFDVQVSRSGAARKVTSVFTTPSLVKTATSAVKKWRFSPGQYQGKPARSNAVVAFVFRSPTITTPYGSQTK